ncbi:hypothetical protein SALBM217S_06781 [Streptomyces griseoloalbus]
MRHLDSLLEHHLLPLLGSRRMDTFDHRVVEGFIRSMERAGVGLATQSNAFDKLKAILLDAHRLGLYDDHPLTGVKPPQYDPKRAVIPSPQQLRTREAGDDRFQADHRPDERLRHAQRRGRRRQPAQHRRDYVYRITEQVNQTTGHCARLKHRKTGEYRDVPLPARVKHTIERYADTHSTTDGYLLRHPLDASKAVPALLPQQPMAAHGVVGLDAADPGRQAHRRGRLHHCRRIDRRGTHHRRRRAGPSRRGRTGPG